MATPAGLLGQVGEFNRQQEEWPQYVAREAAVLLRGQWHYGCGQEAGGLPCHGRCSHLQGAPEPSIAGEAGREDV